ncbi:hypothetical protein [Longibacter sp.]
MSSTSPDTPLPDTHIDDMRMDLADVFYRIAVFGSIVMLLQWLVL